MNTEIITDKQNKSYAIGIIWNIPDIETKIHDSIALHGNRPLKNKRHYITQPKTIDGRIRDMKEYSCRHVHFSLNDFTEKDIAQISATMEGTFVINQCRIPVINGALVLNQMYSRYAHNTNRVKHTAEELKESRKESQKRYIARQKAIAKGLIIEDIDNSITFKSMPSIFRSFAKSNSVKRLITAKHIEPDSLYIPDMFFEDCFFRPLVDMDFVFMEKEKYQNYMLRINREEKELKAYRNREKF